MHKEMLLWTLTVAVLASGCARTGPTPTGSDETATPTTHVVAHRYVEEVPETVTGAELSEAFEAGTPWRTLAERSWKVRLGHMTRSARWLPHGEVWSEPLWPLPPGDSPGTLPPGCLLELDFGGLGAAQVFELEIVDSDGTTLEATTLEAQQARQWFRHTLDLDAWAGRRPSLRLTARSGGGVPFAGGRLLAPSRHDQPRPDVVLVVIDTLRADRMSLYGHGRRTTPHLDRWAEDHAIVFERALAPSTWTFPSHVSIFTGLDASSHAAHIATPLSGHFEMLAERLQALGYRTVAVTDGGYVSPELGFAQGFDAYYKPLRLDEQDLDLSIEKARRWMSDAKTPTFLFFHTYDAVHHPLTPRPSFYDALGLEAEFGALDPAWLESLVRGPLEAGGIAGSTHRETLGVQRVEEAFEPLDAEGWRRVAAAYDSGLAYADERIGQWLESLDRDTLTLLTSDHGEALGEHGLAGHAYLYDLNLHVPLLLALPGGEEAGRRIERQVRSVDIAPTILDALGQPVPAVDGRSLLPLVTDPLADWPSEAWSASAWQGVALTVDRRYRYILNTTTQARHQASGALLSERDGFDALLDRSDDPSHHLLHESFRRRVADRFQQDFRGLRVEIRNASESSWRLHLGEHDARIDLRTVKSLDAPATALTVTPGDSAQVRVAPQQSFDVLLEGLAASEPIALRISPADAPSAECRARWPPSPAQPPPRWLDETCAWETERAQSGLHVGWVEIAGHMPVTTGRAELDPEVERQLRALGYIDP